jgi:asparagine synthase (glutamine-hydrolysing)
MCGICGTNNLELDLDPSLDLMQRGRDQKDIVSNGSVQFGFQRHAIVAPNETRTQPYQTDNHLLVANGELFNFEQIAQGIPGYALTDGSTDIDVLHRLILHKGVTAVESLNMMIAGAVFDTAQQALHLFRDWIGEMPLHYTYDPQTKEWFFASSIAAVIKATKKSVDEVMEVPPGYIVTIDVRGVTSQKYYDIQDTPDIEEIDCVEAARNVRALMEKSAAERTWTEVPTCSLISGGVDSLITTYLLLKHGKFDGPLPVYTFHCSDFPETEDTDLYHARKVAAWFGDKVDHRIITVSKEQIIAAIPEVVRSLEDTRGKDFNVFPAIYNRFLAEAIANDGIKLVYEGEGPDEALGSYSSWGQFQASDEEIGRQQFRKKMLGNLHKGVLLRTSKTMMEFGPLECRSFFLDKELLTYLASLPASVIRDERTKKAIMLEAFKDDIPQELLLRPKARPQDSTGITDVLAQYVEREGSDFKSMLQEYFEQLRAA